MHFMQTRQTEAYERGEILFEQLEYLLDGYQEHFSLDENLADWMLTPEDACYLVDEYHTTEVQALIRRFLRYSRQVNQWIKVQPAERLKIFIKGLVLLCLLNKEYRHGLTNYLGLALEQLSRCDVHAANKLYQQVADTVKNVRAPSLLASHSTANYQYNSELFELSKKINNHQHTARTQQEVRALAIQKSANALKTIPIAIHRDIDSLPHLASKILVLDKQLIKEYERHARLSRNKQAKHEVQKLKQRFLQDV